MGIRSFLGLFADGPGKMVRTSVITDEAGNLVNIQAGSVSDPDSTVLANVKGPGVAATSADSALVVALRDGVQISNGALEAGGNLAELVAAQGSSATGVVQLTGGSGLLGWLSGIYNQALAVRSAPGTPQTVAVTVQGHANGVPAPMFPSGSLGRDFSANAPALPNVGANFGSSGPYANYVLTASAPASAARFNIDIENVSGAPIVVVRDDGTASIGGAPANASVFALGGGIAAGAQGGTWASQTFKGRVSLYSPLTTALTFTGSLTAATSGVLSSAWTGATGPRYVTFSDGSVQLASFTNGLTAVTWPLPATASASASAATAQVSVLVD